MRSLGCTREVARLNAPPTVARRYGVRSPSGGGAETAHVRPRALRREIPSEMRLATNLPHVVARRRRRWSSSCTTRTRHAQTHRHLVAVDRKLLRNVAGRWMPRPALPHHDGGADHRRSDHHHRPGGGAAGGHHRPQRRGFLHRRDRVAARAHDRRPLRRSHRARRHGHVSDLPRRRRERLAGPAGIDVSRRGGDSLQLQVQRQPGGERQRRGRRHPRAADHHHADSDEPHRAHAVERGPVAAPGGLRHRQRQRSARHVGRHQARGLHAAHRLRRSVHRFRQRVQRHLREATRAAPRS